MDAIRKQQDVLMGANRNGDVREVDRKCYDRDVCRLFLSGLCPHELFQLTKMDMGPCPKVHSLQLRKEYEEAKAKGVFNFDRDLEDVIDRLIVECDRKIARALKRLDDEDAKAAIAISVSEVTQTPEVQELSKEIKEKLKEADIYDLEGKMDMKIRALEVVEDLRTKRADKQSMLLLDAFNKDQVSLPQPLTSTRQLAPLPATAPDPRVQEMIHEKLKKAEHVGEQGMVDEAQKLLEEAEALKKLPARQEPAPDSFSKYMAADVCITDEKLHVCDICGAFLSVYDSDRRLADHFGGKLHLGYMQIREKLSELQENANATMEHYSQIESSGSVNSSALPNDKAIFVEGVDVFNRDCVHEMGSEATQFREQMHQFQLPGSSSSTPTNVDQIVEIRVQQRIKEIEDQWRRREERLLRMFRTRDAGLISWMELASEKAGVDLPELPSLFDDDEDNDVPFVSPSNRHPGSSVGFDGPPPPPSIGGVALSPT